MCGIIYSLMEKKFIMGSDMEKIFYRLRNFLGSTLLVASVTACFWRFGDLAIWRELGGYFTVLFVQLWFAQAVYEYLRGGG